MSDNLLLKGLKVIDAGSFIAGPVSTTILSDFGAESFHRFNLDMSFTNQSASASIWVEKVANLVHFKRKSTISGILIEKVSNLVHFRQYQMPEFVSILL